MNLDGGTYQNQEMSKNVIEIIIGGLQGYQGCHSEAHRLHIRLRISEASVFE